MFVLIVFCTRETPGSNIAWDLGNPDKGFSLFYSISSRKYHRYTKWATIASFETHFSSFTISGTDSFVKSKPPTLVTNVTRHLVFLTFFMKTVRSGGNRKSATAQYKKSTEKPLLGHTKSLSLLKDRVDTQLTDLKMLCRDFSGSICRKKTH
jgi:hypothetical protein